MSDAQAPGAQVDLARQRLERALEQLEARVTRRLAESEAKLQDLAECEDRTRELEAAGAAAAEALDRAICEIQAVMRAEEA
jgi:hypothetical protein